MAATALDAWSPKVSNTVSADTLTYAISAGSNRFLVVEVGVESSPARTVSSITYGTQNLTQAFTVNAGSGVALLECWYLNEAGIAAASNSDIVVTLTGSASALHTAARSLQDVDQTTPIAETRTATTNASTPNPVVTSITEANGNFILAANFCGNNTAAAWHADLTERVDQGEVSPGSRLSCADRACSTSGTANVECTSTSQNRAVQGTLEITAASGAAFVASLMLLGVGK